MKKISINRTIATFAVIIISTVGAFATSTVSSDTSNGLATVGGVALLIAAIVLPAMKGTKQ